MALISLPFNYNGSKAISGIIYKNVILADNPAAFWQLNETSGTIAHDISGNNLNGTIETGVTIGQTEGIPNSPGSFLFNGSNGYVDVPASSLLCPLSEGSVEAWVNWQGSTTVSGDWLSTGGNIGYRTRYADGNADIVYAQADQLHSTTALGSGFTHVVITFGPSGSQIYQNGVFINSGGAAYSQSAGTQAVHLGACLTYSEYFNGYLSNIAVYNDILTATQIQNHYNAGIA